MSRMPNDTDASGTVSWEQRVDRRQAVIDQWSHVRPMLKRAVPLALLVPALFAGTMYLIAPKVPLPVLPMFLAALVFPVYLLLAPLIAWGRSATRYDMDDRGIRIDRLSRIAWRDIQGVAPLLNAPEVIVLTFADFAPVRIDLADIPNRTEILTFLAAHTEFLPPAPDLPPASRDVLPLPKRLLLAACVFANALLAGAAIPHLSATLAGPLVGRAVRTGHARIGRGNGAVLAEHATGQAQALCVVAAVRGVCADRLRVVERFRPRVHGAPVPLRRRSQTGAIGRRLGHDPGVETTR